MLESQRATHGHPLYYARFDDRSYLRIDFNTLQYDQEKEQKYREQYLFDGVWLTYISHEGRSVQRQQMAEPNEPVDAAGEPRPDSRLLQDRGLPETVRHRTGPAHRGDLARKGRHLHMTVKPDSVYKDDYAMIDFLIDDTSRLPTRVVAVTTEL